MSYQYGITEEETWILGDEKADCHYSVHILFNNRTRAFVLSRKVPSPEDGSHQALNLTGEEAAELAELLTDLLADNE